MTKKVLKDFLVLYYPSLKLKQKIVDGEKFYTLINELKNTNYLENVKFSKIETFAKNELGYMPIFMQIKTEYVLQQYMSIVFDRIIRQKQDVIEIYEKDNLHPILKFQDLESFQDWLLINEEGYLKQLIPYICPECMHLGKHRDNEGNAIIYTCPFCKHKIIELL